MPSSYGLPSPALPSLPPPTDNRRRSASWAVGVFLSGRGERERRQGLAALPASADAAVRAAAAQEIADLRGHAWAVRQLAGALDKEPTPETFEAVAGRSATRCARIRAAVDASSTCSPSPPTPLPPSSVSGPPSWRSWEWASPWRRSTTISPRTSAAGWSGCACGAGALPSRPACGRIPSPTWSPSVPPSCWCAARSCARLRSPPSRPSVPGRRPARRSSGLALPERHSRRGTRRMDRAPGASAAHRPARSPRGRRSRPGPRGPG